jgi:hypothetical protein
VLLDVPRLRRIEREALPGYFALCYPFPRKAACTVSTCDEQLEDEHLVFHFYTPAQFETIRNFASTSDGKAHVMRGLSQAFTDLRLASRGLPPTEDAKVWTARPPSEEAKRWDDIFGAADHLCSLLDAESTKWMPVVGDMTLALAFYQASRQTIGTPESTEEPRPLFALYGGIAGLDPITWKIVELRRNIGVLAQAALSLARDAKERVGRDGRPPDLVSLFVEDLFRIFIDLKTKVEPSHRKPGFSRGGPLNRFIEACVHPMRRKIPMIPPLTPDQLNSRYREWVKRSKS